MSAIANRIPFRARAMLATLVHEPFHRAGWVYEEKYDGERLLAYKEGRSVQLLSRNGRDHTAAFPRIAAAVRRLRPRTLLLDGEAVVFDRRHVSRFQLLQEDSGKATYAVFDCLYKDGTDLRALRLDKRRDALERVVRSAGPLRLSRRLSPNGLTAFEVAKQRGFEGLVAKDLSSPYVGRRSHSWLKVKVRREDEFVIVGYTAPAGSRKHIGALLLGAYEGKTLRYVGKVGTGFTQKELAALSRRFAGLVRSRIELLEAPGGKNVTYLQPSLVAQIAYQELTRDRKLRQPVYLGLRDDKRPRDVSLSGLTG